MGLEQREATFRKSNRSKQVEIICGDPTREVSLADHYFASLGCGIQDWLKLRPLDPVMAEAHAMLEFGGADQYFDGFCDAYETAYARIVSPSVDYVLTIRFEP